MGEILSLFATPIVKVNINREFTNDELRCLLTIPIMKDEKSGVPLHQSEDLHLFDNFSEDLKDIKKFCEHQLEIYLEKIEGITDKATLRITKSWLNKMKPQEFHHSHFHPNSYLSGVLYIKCLPNNHINFKNRSYGLYNNIEISDYRKNRRKKLTVWNSSGAIVNVKEGDLIIFPSWISHSVNVNETKDQDRISFSFNTIPRGEIYE